MEAENIAPQPVMVRRTEPKAMARDMEGKAAKIRVWKRVAFVAAVGMLFGFGASFWMETPKSQRGSQIESSNLRQTSVVIVPTEPTSVKQTVGDEAEVERLKTRNRRLEALVQVLQHRAKSGKHASSLKIKN